MILNYNKFRLCFEIFPSISVTSAFIRVLSLLCVLSVFSGSAFAQDTTTQKLNLAVADFAGKNVSTVESSIISDFVRTRLVNSDVFNVMNRTNMEMILKEYKFQLSGCTDQQCAVELGKLLNMQKILIGSVSKLVDIYYIDISIIDIETGKIEISRNEECSEVKNLKPTAENLAVKLVRSYGKNESMGLADSTPRIKSVSGDVILIDKGKKDKIKTRNIYYIIDDESQIKIGMLKITGVREKESSAKLMKMLSGYYKTKVAPGMPLEFYSHRKVLGIGVGIYSNNPFFKMECVDEYGVSLNISLLSAYTWYINNYAYYTEYFNNGSHTSSYVSEGGFFKEFLSTYVRYNFFYDSPISFYIGGGLSFYDCYYEKYKTKNVLDSTDSNNIADWMYNFGVTFFAYKPLHIFLDVKFQAFATYFHGRSAPFGSIGLGASYNW